MTRLILVLLLLAIAGACAPAGEESPPDEQGRASQPSPALERALTAAAQNRPEIARALAEVPADQKPGMHFLVENMPQRDLESLTAEFLLENVRLAYAAWDETPWKDDVPEEIFLNNVLPYASVSEEREPWRQQLYDRFKPLVKDALTASEAAVILNQKIYPVLNVRYSVDRNRSDQAPSESIETGIASCTGLSILLINASRAVGVPARFVGTPMWTDNSGNHSWVEIWDDGEWHFTGAAEPTDDRLNDAWFEKRAATAIRDDLQHAIYAVSYKRTPQIFPLEWNPDADYVHAVNVTDRYTRLAQPLPEGHVEVMFRAIDRESGRRRAVDLKVIDDAGEVRFEGQTNDERFDANDHLVATLPAGEEYRVEFRDGTRLIAETIRAERRDTPLTFELDPL